MIYITVLDYCIGSTTIYTSERDLSEEEIEELIGEEHNLGDTYYMVSNTLTLDIKPI